MPGRGRAESWRWNFALVPRAAAARSAASMTTGSSSPARSAVTQQVLSVLQTLRSSECSTASASRFSSASSATTSHAPPVPCSDTGTPAWRATAPNWATAAPEPRATASDRRVSPNIAHAAAWLGLSTSVAAPAGRPTSASAGSNACSTMARAVPSASEPMRNTTVSPARSTPQASAKTLGRPSNTKAITPSPSTTSSTCHPSCSMRSRIAPRTGSASRHTRRPSTMSWRICGESTSRVVERPRCLARATSSALAVAIAPNTSSSSSRCANAS